MGNIFFILNKVPINIKYVRHKNGHKKRGERTARESNKTGREEGFYNEVQKNSDYGFIIDMKGKKKKGKGKKGNHLLQKEYVPDELNKDERQKMLKR